ncbi:MAG: T9SS type A sorting domain-containing protein [Candidatus Zixiibacteriota bacterium]|nr:MAG: T9SS type A sorting domain-containing protein [candidate division Zixibacteria bacterium]
MPGGRAIRSCFCAGPALAILLAAAALPAGDRSDRTPPSTAAAYDKDTYIDANRLLMFVTNTGSFGHQDEHTFGRQEGLYFPFRTIDDITSGLYDRTAMYAAGPWLGAIDHDTGDTLTAISEFSDDFWPGPMFDGTFDPNGDINPDYRVYKLYADSLAGNPGGDYEDYMTYAVPQGAPVDNFGQPAMLGDQMLWTVYNDANPDARTSYYSITEPLGVEIRQTVWAAMEGPNLTAVCGDEGTGKAGLAAVDQTIFAVYMRYLIYNKGGRRLDSCFFSLWADPDLGGASDDLVGCDTLDDVFFCYNATNDDYAYGDRPPAVGFKFLHGPLVPSSGDSACFDGTWISDYRNLNMTSFIKYVGGDDPQNYRQIYEYMNGLNASAGGIPLPNGTTYMLPGDPVTGEGDIDFASDDRRMMGTCGPFDMAPGDSQYVLVKVAVGLGDDRLSSITRLREILNGLTPSDTGDVVPPVPSLPTTFRLSQNYPNPFPNPSNPLTRIEFSVPVACRAKIDIYNIVGQKVKTLVDADLPAGRHFVDWDGTDRDGEVAASGLYFYKLTAGDHVSTRKMLLAK